MRKLIFINTLLGQRYADQLVKYYWGYKKEDHGENVLRKPVCRNAKVTGQSNADQVVRDYWVIE